MVDDSPPVVALFDEDLVVPAGDRDRWLHAGLSELGRLVGSDSYEVRPSEANDGAYDVHLRGGESEAILEVLFLPTEVVQCRLRNYGNQEEVDAWRDAFKIAWTRIAETVREFAWSSLVGLAPVPDTSMLSNAKLSDDMSLGPFSLEVSPRRLIEYVSAPLEPNARNVLISWPARLKGTARGRDWWEARHNAAYDIRLVCALISLISSQCWVARSDPYELSAGEIPFPTTDSVIDERHGADNYGEPRPIRSIPWLEGALQIIQHDRALSDTLIAFHESLLLAPSHPTMAVVALVAAIESIGARHVELTRCSCCDRCSVQSGYAGRFRTMLGRVLFEAEAKKVARAYTNRSGTAHGGTLFGHDRRLGIMGQPSMLAVDPDQQFSKDLVFALTKSCRRLLILELGGEQTWTLTENDMPGGLVAAAVVLGGTTIEPPHVHDSDAGQPDAS